jgi:hypothetical protein
MGDQDMNFAGPDWKVQFRDGKLKTPFRHYTAMVEGIVVELSMGFKCRPGYAFMVMKVWASSPDEAMDLVKTMCEQVGFDWRGQIHVFVTDPALPPKKHPYGYDVDFTPFLEPKTENKA